METTPSSHLVDLARHMEWADAQVWTSVLDSSAAQADTRLRLLLYHVHLVQRAFLHLWRGQTPAFPDPAEFADAFALARWGREGHEQVQAFLAAADRNVLARPLTVPWASQIEQAIGRSAFPPTIAQTATQLALHSSHHRGQMNMRLRESGTEPPLVDYILWVWSGQPQATWPADVTAGIAT